MDILFDRQYAAPAAATSATITLPGPSTPWVDSNIVELAASMPTNAVLTGVVMRGLTTTANYAIEIVIGTGAAGSEVAIATFLAYTKESFGVDSLEAGGVLPTSIGIANIAAGDRLSAWMRGGTTLATQTYVIAATYLELPLVGTMITTANPTQVTPSGSGHVTVTASATPWDNGSEVQMRAASGAELALVSVSIAPSTVVEVEFGPTGFASSYATVRVMTGVTGMPSIYPFPYPVTVPSGASVAVRVRSPTANATALVGYTYVELPL